MKNILKLANQSYIEWHKYHRYDKRRLHINVMTHTLKWDKFI